MEICSLCLGSMVGEGMLYTEILLMSETHGRGGGQGVLCNNTSYVWDLSIPLMSVTQVRMLYKHTCYVCQDLW